MNKKISELDEVTDVDDSDLLVVVRGGVDKKTTRGNFKAGLGGGDMVVVIPANQFALPASGNPTREFNYSNAGENSLKYPNNSTTYASVAVQVPKGATEISSIEIISVADAIANLVFNVYTTFALLDGSVSTADNELGFVVGSPHNSGNIDLLAVPSGAYSAHTIVEDGLLSIRLARVGGDASDTYNMDWIFSGLKITFA